MRVSEQQARAAQLLAAGLELEDVAERVGVSMLRLVRWHESRRFQHKLYLAILAYQSQLEASRVTGGRARGFLPVPMVLQDLQDEEDGEDADA